MKEKLNGAYVFPMPEIFFGRETDNQRPFLEIVNSSKASYSLPHEFTIPVAIFFSGFSQKDFTNERNFSL